MTIVNIYIAAYVWNYKWLNLYFCMNYSFINSADFCWKLILMEWELLWKKKFHETTENGYF